MILSFGGEFLTHSFSMGNSQHSGVTYLPLPHLDVVLFMHFYGFFWWPCCMSFEVCFNKRRELLRINTRYNKFWSICHFGKPFMPKLTLVFWYRSINSR